MYVYVYYVHALLGLNFHNPEVTDAILQTILAVFFMSRVVEYENDNHCSDYRRSQSDVRRNKSHYLVSFTVLFCFVRYPPEL